MPVQIADPQVVAKIDRLSKLTGLSKTAAVEKAVDLLLEQKAAPGTDVWERMDAILAEIDRVPDRSRPSNPLDWDEQGLPR